MAVNDYRFIDRWRVRGTLDEVWAIMTDGAEFKRWWPGIYLDARELVPGDDDGLGKTIRLPRAGRAVIVHLALAGPYHPRGQTTTRWAMRVGERSLRLELARRRAQTPEEAAHIPSPPGPVTARRVLPWMAVAVVGVIAIVLMRR